MKIILILLTVATCCLAVDPVFFTIGFVKNGLFDPADTADLEPCGDRTSGPTLQIIQGFILINQGKGNIGKLKVGLEQSINGMHGFISLLDPCANAHENLKLFAQTFRNYNTDTMLKKVIIYQALAIQKVNDCLVYYTHGDAAPAGQCVASVFLWLLNPKST